MIGAGLEPATLQLFAMATIKPPKYTEYSAAELPNRIKGYLEKNSRR